MKNLKINLDFIPSKIYFFIGAENHNSFIDKYKTGSDWYLNNDGLTTDLWNDKKGHIVMISITNNPFDVYEIKGLIVHEITHAVSFIMSRHGFICEEMKAYLSQYLYIKIMKYYDKEISNSV